ncbi:MAG: hypothetical protein RQ885_06010 [Desulfurococcales archaeon]|nr:hypothetical protein [Desulfurococcales archaeon]
MDNMVKIFCGSEDMCLEELGEILSLYRDLHRICEDIDVDVDFDPKVYPLISSMKNPRDLVRIVTNIMQDLGIDMDEDKVLSYILGRNEFDDRGSIASYI